MYSVLGIHFNKLLWLLWPLRFIFKMAIQPTGISREKILETTGKRDIIYVLPRMSMVDVFVLNLVLRQLRMPRVRAEARPNDLREASLMALRPPAGLTPFERGDAFHAAMESFLAKDARAAEGKIVLQPVSVFWGRVPERNERNFILRMFFPDDGRANALQKIWIVALHFRNIHVHFSAPVEMTDAAPATNGDDPHSTAGKSRGPEFARARHIRRLLLIEFNRERTAALGPSLYDFNSMADHILSAPATKRLVTSLPGPREKTESDVVRYLAEIAADYNYLTIQAFERVLDFVWTRVFRGVRVRNFDQVFPIAKAGQILWMPCHRSHFDYMLLSYLLKKRGLVVPHIAAGINLNFWPAGSILRRSGAFFLRRSFHGNRVYSHTFSQYIDFLMHNGFALEFFQEGGRSRIGKLLGAKRGILGMCVGSMIRRRSENTYIVPVYFGYEKVLEDEAYARELMGAKKHKESIFHFLASLRKMFDNFGRVDVSFGHPIHVGAAWQEYFGANRDSDIPALLSQVPEELDPRHKGVQEFVKFLSRRVNMGINAAATASGSAMMAAILLSLNEPIIEEPRLAARIRLLHWVVGQLRQSLDWSIATSAGVENSTDFLISQLPKPESAESQEDPAKRTVGTLPLSPPSDIENVVREIIADGIGWMQITEKRGESSGGVRVLMRNPQKEMNLWWYRGTIFHVLAIPGLVATILLDLPSEERSFAKVVWWMTEMRKLWAEELFWPEETSTERLAQAGLDILRELAVCRAHEDGRITLSDSESVLEYLYFFADLVRPERELYSLQVCAALNLVESRGRFSREQLILRTVQGHRAAFLRGAAMQPASHSQVFGRRVFDALAHVDIFVASGDNQFTVVPEKLTPILDFFEIPIWKDFLH